MRENDYGENLQNRRKKFRKRLLICVGALLLAVVLFFGTILILQVKVRYSYEALADGIRVAETADGALLIQADPKVYPENTFEPSGWISRKTEWQTVAVDEESGILYCSVIVCGCVKRGEKWFGAPATKTLYQESLSPRFPDDNPNYEYRYCICEVYYLEWDLPGWTLITYGDPVLLWSRDLPDGVTPLAEPQKYHNPYREGS